MTTVPFSMVLLNIIAAVKAKKNFALAESMLNISSHHYQATEDYFNSLPTELLKSVGLVKNRYCFEAVLNFDHAEFEKLSKVPEEELNQYNFKY